MNRMIRLVLLTFFIFSSWANAAPMPLTPSSMFFSIEKGIFRSPLGFSIHLAKTDWVQVRPPKDNPFIAAIYQAPGPDSSVQAALTVRTDLSEKATGLEDYAEKWLKDYPRFGFEILTSKKIRLADKNAYLIDLVNRDAGKQLRQVLFMKSHNVVTLTCRDDMKSFGTTLKTCNEIIRTFRW